ncbi:hypothetical protein BC628DRAFT_1334127, partial [Trametes gibbosa]
GSPFTLGKAQAHLQASSLGPCIKFVHSDPLCFLNNTTEHYSTAVLAQCSWYFTKPKVFSKILPARLSSVDRVCISEYSLTVSDHRAIPHVLATLAQASLECRKLTSQSNVRTVMSPIHLRNTAATTGWTVAKQTTQNVPEGMLDGKWEVGWVLSGDFMAEVEKAVQDGRERLVVLAAGDAVLGAYGLLQDQGESVRTMDVWVATLNPVTA